MSATYKAIQVTKPGEFEEVVKLLVDPGPVKCAFGSRRPVSATRMPARWKDPFQSSGRAPLGTKWSGGSMPLALACRVGRLVSASVSASSEALAVTANSVEMSIL